MPPPGGIITDRLRRATRNAFISNPRLRPAKRQRRQEARRRTQLNADTTSGAQCFPRHACPLDGAVLMQVHERFESASALATHGLNGQPLRVQSHAPNACTD